MKDYKRLTDRGIAEMLINTEGGSWDSDNIEAQCYIRLAELEDKIESGELYDRKETARDIVEMLKVAKGVVKVHFEAYDELVENIVEKYGIDWEDEE